MKIEVDKHSGFCFGVVYAIQMAEEELEQSPTLYCLGDIVHNNMEVERLTEKGLRIISHADLSQIKNAKVLIRAHGEPPETYKIAIENNIELIDASCPVVLRLQQSVRRGYEEVLPEQGQVVIFGKQGHAEVNGLVGQTNQSALVINSIEEIDKIDFSKPIRLYSQTTHSKPEYLALIEACKQRLPADVSSSHFLAFQTNCAQVSSRVPQIEQFAQTHSVIIFVSGKKSSNGKFLFEAAQKVNSNTYFVSDTNDIDMAWFDGSQVSSVGICGATSTPKWLMDKVVDKISQLNTYASARFFGVI